MTFAGEFLGLPGLRGYWPMGAFDSSGNAIDQSGNVRTLTYNGGGTGPTYNFTTQGGPYADLDGTSDFFSRADEAGLDITGTATTESYVASTVRGLTTGGWFKPDTIAPGVAGVLTAKSNNSTQKSWDMFEGTTGTITARVSTDGSAIVQAVSVALANTNWFFACMVYVPSTSLTIYINALTPVVNSTSIPASIFNSTSAFTIGSFSGGGNTFFGLTSNCFLCAMALSATAIDNIYQGTRDFYGI